MLIKLSRVAPILKKKTSFGAPQTQYYRIILLYAPHLIEARCQAAATIPHSDRMGGDFDARTTYTVVIISSPLASIIWNKLLVVVSRGQAEQVVVVQ